MSNTLINTSRLDFTVSKLYYTIMPERIDTFIFHVFTKVMTTVIHQIIYRLIRGIN